MGAASTQLHVVTAAYTCYVLLCFIAICSTFQDSRSSHTWMRVPLVVMLVVLTANFSIFAFLGHLNTPKGVHNILRSVMLKTALQIAMTVATCLAGVLSDSLLAWRCFVLFGKRPWMKWLLAVLIALDFGIGSLSNIAIVAYLRLVSEEERGSRPNHQTSQTSLSGILLSGRLLDIWAWIFFSLNTIMTISIIYKIFSSAHRAKGLTGPCKDYYIYNTAIRAIIESSLIAWTGLLVYAITRTDSFELDSSTEKENAKVIYEYSFSLLAFVFGISQTLIIARIGFSRLRSPSSAAKFAARFLASDERVVEEENRADLVIDITKNGDDIESIAVRPLPQNESA